MKQHNSSEVIIWFILYLFNFISVIIVNLIIFQKITNFLMTNGLKDKGLWKGLKWQLITEFLLHHLIFDSYTVKPQQNEKSLPDL